MISQGHFRITLKIYLYKRHFNSRLRRSKGKTRSSSRDRHLQRRGSLKRAEESSTANRVIDVKGLGQNHFFLLKNASMKMASIAMKPNTPKYP
jgi:hypothetical protein